jgi:hypothetical protein
VTIRGDPAAISDCRSKVFQDLDGGFPVDARISDTDSFLKSGWSLGWDLLVAFINIGFDHDTDDGGLACAKLFCDDCCYFRLVSVVFVGVALANVSAEFENFVR